MRIILNYGHDHNQQPPPEAQGPALTLASNERQAQEARQTRQAQRDLTPSTDDETDDMMLDEPREKGKPESRPDSDQTPEVNDADVAIAPATFVKEEFECNEEKNGKREKQDQNITPAHVVSFPCKQSVFVGNHALRDYEMMVKMLERENRKRLMLVREEHKFCRGADQNPRMIDTASVAHASIEESQEENTTWGKQDQDVIYASEISSPDKQPILVGNRAQQDLQMQLIILEQQNKKRMMLARKTHESRCDADQNPSMIDTVTALASATTKGPLEKHATKRKQDQDAKPAPAIFSAGKPFSIDNNAPLDYQMQLMWLEQHSRKRFMLAIEEQKSRLDADQNPSMIDAAAAAVAASATTEGPLKNNTTMGKQDQDAVPAPAISSPGKPCSIANQTPLDYQTQLMMLEQSSKKRLEQARQEQKSRRDRDQNRKEKRRLELANHEQKSPREKKPKENDVAITAQENSKRIQGKNASTPNQEVQDQSEQAFHHVPPENANTTFIQAVAPVAPITPASSKGLSNHALQDYQMTLTILEQQRFQRRKLQRLQKQAQESNDPSAFVVAIAATNAALNDNATISAAIAHLEHRAPPQVPSQEANITSSPSTAAPAPAPTMPMMPAPRKLSYTDAMQDYQTNLKIWEQQNSKRRKLKEKAHQSDDRTLFTEDIAALTAAVHATAATAIAALDAAIAAVKSADYETTKIPSFESYQPSEQRNPTIFFQEANIITTTPVFPPMRPVPGGGLFDNHLRLDYQSQLMMLELQNKKRLLIARTQDSDDPYEFTNDTAAR